MAAPLPRADIAARLRGGRRPVRHPYPGALHGSPCGVKVAARGKCSDRWLDLSMLCLRGTGGVRSSTSALSDQVPSIRPHASGGSRPSACAQIGSAMWRMAALARDQLGAGIVRMARSRGSVRWIRRGSGGYADTATMPAYRHPRKAVTKSMPPSYRRRPDPGPSRLSRYARGLDDTLRA